MANNSNRKAIEFMVRGALPPHNTNVLWMDTSVPTLPVLKIFENGAWTTVHTGDSKALELLAETVLAQQREITELTEDIKSKMALDATVAKDNTVAKQQTLTQGIENISNAINNIDTSDLAKEATLGTSSDTSVATTIFGWLKSIRDFLVEIVTTSPYAKEASVKDGNDTVIAVTKAAKTAVGTAPIGSNKTTVFQYLAAIYDSIDQFNGITKADIEAELNENTTQS